ncbi:class I SAM-dependent methyltransferase [Oribacterium sp. Sow4_G1_1]|uniref:class I SAM-dependent methyltransferase n=1 Tax=Oribacterium sp. Sow4_G1_1 TaxID=3438794 RepID=UPI003F966A0C
MNMTCIACGHALSPLMTLDDMPASAQNIPAASELAEDHPLSLTLCQCPSCGLVQFDTEPVDYYRDVIRAGGGTRTMTRLRHEEYARLLTAMQEHHIHGRRIVEVGCGRGEFLRMWQNLAEDPEGAAALARDQARDPLSGQPNAAPLHLVGLEHKPSLVEEANAVADKKYRVYEGFATGDVRYPEGPFDAFVQFNFLEHQPDPCDMLRNIGRNLKPQALGLITVPSFEYILRYNGYYELLRDHIANYTEFTLQKLLQDCGFELLSMDLVNRDTIEAIVRKADPDELSELHYSGRLIDVSALRDSYDRLSASVNAHIDHLSESHRTMAIWGASHQGFTLAATTKLGGRVEYIIDSAPFKQGRFSPASHIPIVAPDYTVAHPVDEILIVAPGYTDEIAGIIRERFDENVRILVLRTDRIEEYR